jgi:hypothetical protein
MASVLAHLDGHALVFRHCCGDRQGDAIVAQHFALVNASDPKTPPEKGGLTRHWQDVARHDGKRGTEPAYQKYTYYWHIVDQTKLAQDMGWKLGKR